MHIAALSVVISQAACNLNPRRHAVPPFDTSSSTPAVDAKPGIIYADDIPVVEKGITVDQLRAVLQEATGPRFSHPKHQFTVWHGGNRVTCLIAKVHPKAAYYFVFVEGTLETIVEPPAVEFDVIEGKDRSLTMVRKSVSLEELEKLVLQSEGLSSEEFIASAKKKIVASREARRALEPNPILMLFPTREDRPNYRRHTELMQKYDATKIQLGMLPEKVEEVFGLASDVKRLDGDGDMLHVYGEDADIGWFSVPWVSVTFKNYKVMAVSTSYVNEYGR